jgi:hypothetical protein
MCFAHDTWLRTLRAFLPRCIPARWLFGSDSLKRHRLPSDRKRVFGGVLRSVAECSLANRSGIINLTRSQSLALDSEERGDAIRLRLGERQPGGELTGHDEKLLLP